MPGPLTMAGGEGGRGGGGRGGAGDGGGGDGGGGDGGGGDTLYVVRPEQKEVPKHFCRTKNDVEFKVFVNGER